MPNETAVRTFITSAFRSVWALDLLQVVHAQPDRKFTRDELIDVLRASELVVTQSADSLMAAGLVMTDDNGLIQRYAVDHETEQLISASIELYRKSPDKVRRMIVAQTLPGVTAFADAFRLRKD